MHTYTAALRVAGETLDVQSVGHRFGLTPTHVVKVGDNQQRGPATTAMWSFEAFPVGGGEWHSFEDAITAILTVFSPHVRLVRDLQRQFDVYLWCGHFTSSFDGGPKLSADLLRRLGEFGVDLFLDTYSSANE